MSGAKMAETRIRYAGSPYETFGVIESPKTHTVIQKVIAPAPAPGEKRSFPSFFLSNFTEHELLGNGAYGTVVLCSNEVDGQDYAIKKIKIDTSYAKAQREAGILGELNHQNIVRYSQSWLEKRFVGVYKDEDCFQDEYKPCLFIQLELCDGDLLSKLNPGPNSRETWITPVESAKTFKDIITGVAYLHDKGLVHGDLYSRNILYKNGIAKICDFGMSTKVGSFAAKEADIYQCGLLLFEMLQPFIDSVSQDRTLGKLGMKKELPDSWKANPVREWILKMIRGPSKRPHVRSKRRKPSAAELLESDIFTIIEQSMPMNAL